MMCNKVLLMWSGGVDSTGTLYQLLTEPQHKEFKIYAHHIHIVNKEGRVEAEKTACDKIILCLRNKGFVFDYTENTLDFNFMTGLPTDMDLAYFMTGWICRVDKTITHISRGRTYDDGLNNAVLDSRERGLKILEILTGVPTPEHLFTQTHLTKKQVWELMPKELRELCWYCRFPIKNNDGSFSICGQCHTCHAMSRILN